VQTVAFVFGGIYLVVGVLGFIGPLIGNGGGLITISQDKHTLLGLADVNLLHNLVHLVIGVAGLAAASTVANSRTFCRVFGVVLLLVGVVGIFVSNLFGVLPFGGADIAFTWPAVRCSRTSDSLHRSRHAPPDRPLSS